MNFRLTCLLGVLVLFTSCSDFLKGSSDKNQVIEFKNQSLQCFEDVPTQIQSFWKGSVKDSEIKATFSCLNQVLQDMKNRVEGRAEADSFTSEDLQIILNQFYKKGQVTLETSQQMLHLKQALFGGSADKLTKVEIQQVQDFLDKAQTELLKISPYMALYQFKKEIKKLSLMQIQTAFHQLKSSLSNLILPTNLDQSTYGWIDLKKIILKIEGLTEEDNQLIDQAEMILNLIRGFDSNQIFSKNEIDVILNEVVEAMFLHSQQQNSLVEFSLVDAVQLQTLVTYAEAWVQWFENSLQYEKTKLVSVATLEPFMRLVHQKGLLPASLSAETWQLSYKVIIQRVLGRAPQSNQKIAELSEFQGLNTQHFAQAKKELALFKLYLNFINQFTDDSLTDSKTRTKLAIIQQKLSVYEPQKQEAVLAQFSVQQRENILKDFNVLAREFLSERPVIYRFKKMVIARNQSIWDQNWQDLVQALIAKMVAREWARGWGELNPATSQFELSKASWNRWFLEFEKIGLELNFFDQRIKNLSLLLFDQANLFTYAGNGNQVIEEAELTQFTNMIISAENAMDDFKKQLELGDCKILAVNEIIKSESFKEDCFKSVFFNQRKIFISNLSYLNLYIDNINTNEFYSFYNSLMDIVRTDLHLSGIKVETYDARSLVMLMYYMESLFAVYDLDSNMTFSPAEIRYGYPRFKTVATDYAYKYERSQIDLFNSFGALGGYGCYSEADLIQESFIFLAYHGHIPEIGDLNAVPCLFGRSLINFSGEVDRKTMINTFKILKDVLGS